MPISQQVMAMTRFHSCLLVIFLDSSLGAAVVKRAMSSTPCGGDFEGMGGVIELPFGASSTPNSELKCTWILQAPKGHNLFFHAEYFHLPKERFSGNCQDAALRFYSKNNMPYMSVIPAACGDEMAQIEVDSNIVSVEYVEKTTDFQLSRQSKFTVVWTAFTQDPQCVEKGGFQCWSTGRCIDPSLVCNGHSNCGYDNQGVLDVSDEICEKPAATAGGFWEKNWNVLVSVSAVVSVTGIGVVSYYLRHRAILAARNRRRAEAMRKRERHFDDPLPPIPPTGSSEMGTQSSLNITTTINEYAPPIYDTNSGGGNKFVAMFGPPPGHPLESTAMVESPFRNQQRKMHAMASRASSSRGSSSPRSCRSAPAQRHQGNGCHNSSHRMLPSDSNDSDSVFSGSERGGISSSCKRRGHDCTHKKQHHRHHYTKVRTHSDSHERCAIHSCSCTHHRQQPSANHVVNAFPTHQPAVNFRQQPSPAITQLPAAGGGGNPPQKQPTRIRTNPAASQRRISRSQDFLDQPPVESIYPHKTCRSVMSTGSQSQGYHSESDHSCRSASNRNHRRMPVGNSRGYRSETDEIMTSRNMNTCNNMSARAFALLRKQQQQQQLLLLQKTNIPPLQ